MMEFIDDKENVGFDEGNAGAQPPDVELFENRNFALHVRSQFQNILAFISPILGTLRSMTLRPS
jgi:hypothetical protein